MKPNLEKLLTLFCGVAGSFYCAWAILHVVHDLIIAGLVGCLVGGFLGGVVSGLIQVSIAEPENFIYAGVAVALFVIMKTLWGHSTIGWLFAW